MKLKFIIGSAGTGKTSLLIKSINQNCVVLAYTHSAVNNIKEKIESLKESIKPKKISTIHKYFQIDFSNKIHKVRDFTNYIFIDEFSLIPLELFNKICDILQNINVTVVCFGDILQLGPVELNERVINYELLKKSLNGEVYDYIMKRFICNSSVDYLNLFYHLSTTLFVSKYFKQADKLILNKCYRYNDEILQLTSKPLNELKTISLNESLSKLNEFIQNKTSFVVLSSKYKYLKIVGSRINRHTHNIKCGSVDFGDSVILQSTIDKNFYNGDTVKYIDSNTIQNNDGEILTQENLTQELMPIWLSSIHKSQGREWDNVIIIINDMFSYGMIYTAITRAKKQVIFIDLNLN